MPAIPPRLLTGITLLFWGGLTDNALFGLIAAILIESKSWISTRWQLTDISYVKAWHLCVLSAAIVGILSWLNGLRLGEIHTLFVWVPLFLLPLELAQRYGTRDQIALNTFSFFARKKRQIDSEMGRESPMYMINTGYLYIAMTVLATAMGSKDDIYHFFGLSMIVAACLFSSARKNGVRPFAWGIALITCLILAFTGQWTARTILERYTGANGEAGRDVSATESRTGIGKLGKIKLSPKVFWRMKVYQENVPDLLTTAIYNSYSKAVWKLEKSRNEDRDKNDYKGPENIELTKNSVIHVFKDERSYLENKEFITLTGQLSAKLQENPIPVPHYPAAFSTTGRETSLESNSLGTVRMVNADYNTVKYAVWQDEESNTEEPPNNKNDLSIPTAELAALSRVNESLGLNDESLSTIKKIQRLKSFFNTQFTYTTHLKAMPLYPITKVNAVGNFLEKTKAGHCEYFATATALLLREQGIPTRYCVGFSVGDKAKSGNQWLIRGTSAHAWCRVWIDGRWENIDLTPSSWEDIEATDTPAWQIKLNDWWQLAREDFLLWRTSSQNKSKVFTATAIIFSLVLVWIIWRLWTSNKTSRTSSSQQYLKPDGIEFTALNQLEPLVAKKIGSRPTGTPFTEWITGIEQLEPSLSEKLSHAKDLHLTIRFDTDDASSNDKQELSRIVKDLRTTIKPIKVRKN